MKNKAISLLYLSFFVLVIFSAFSCATAGGGTSGISLLEAIEQSAERIAADLPPGTRIAVTAFESEKSNLSDFIMEELSAALFDRGMEVVERLSLQYVYRELNFQMSGDVSDESAQSIGKFLGAQLVVAGQFRHLGASYRFTANAMWVEKATRASVPRYEVRNDRALRDMIMALDRQPVTARAAGYGEGRIPQTAGTFLDRGILFAIRGDYDMAIEDFTEAIRLNPDMAGAYILRGRALFASVSRVTEVSENFSGVGTFTTGGQISAEQVQIYDLAIEDLTEAIRLDPNSSVVYIERGRAYAHKGDFDRAIADYNQALRLDPNDASAYNYRGIAYAYKGDYDRAIADYTQALRIDPNYASAYNNRGLEYRSKGDYDRAIADYTQALRIDSNDASAYYNRGLMYLDNKGDYNRAIADLTQTLRLNPNDADAYNLRGSAYYNKRDWNRAIADYEAALRIDPNHPYASQNLEIARRRGQ